MDERTTFYREDEVKSSEYDLMSLTIFDGSDIPRHIDLLDYNKEKITFGRNPTNDIVLKSSIVSGNHGYFIIKNKTCIIHDNNSSNGLFKDMKAISSHLLNDGDTIRIDNIQAPMEKGVSLLFTTNEIETDWKIYELKDKSKITIGRDEKCDICLKHVSVSKIHAIVTYENGEFYLTDNNSTNGVSINGDVISGKHKLNEKDLIMITNSKLIFTSKHIAYYCFTGGIGVDAIDIVKTVKNKGSKFNISNHISLSIKSSEFVAIIGGSGAGKTTFMNCISGYNRATSGQVIVNGDSDEE